MENPYQPPDAEAERPARKRGGKWLRPMVPLIVGLVGLAVLWLLVGLLIPAVR